MREKLETYYKLYNRRSYVHPDPLEFLYRFKDSEDIEITGIIASCLAFGRVAQILKSISSVLDKMDNRPSYYLNTASEKEIFSDFKGFIYRFVGEKEITSLLFGLRNIKNDFGTIEKCFAKGVSESDDTVFPALIFFDQAIKKRSPSEPGYLFADPLRGSGCKRMNLFLRWMVRRDEVDPGIWDSVDPSRLIVPVDTHMLKIGQRLGLTKRRQGSMKTAIEITKGFALVSPDDPVKYDFSLTRFGIRGEMSIEDI